MSLSPTLPLDTIVDVTVQVAPQAPAQPTFNQGLIIGNSGVINSQTTRLVKVTSASELLNLGFTTSSPEYIAAQIYFSQLIPALFLWVGAQDPSGINTIIPHAGSTGTGYEIGDVLAVIQGPAINGTLSVTTIGGSGQVTGVQLLTSGHGYGLGTGLATTTNSLNGIGAQVDITAIGEPALQAAIACRKASAAWYEFVVLTANNNDHLALAGWTETIQPVALYFYDTSDASVLGNVVNNFAAQLKALDYGRTIGIYSTTQSGLFPNNIYAAVAMMGVVCGLTTGLAGSYYTLKFKQLVGISTEPLSNNDVANIEANNVNLYLDYADSYNVLEQSTMANGNFFDHILGLDVLVSAIQFGVMNLLTGSPAIPQTDPGQTQIIQAVNQAAQISADIGFIAGGVWRGASILDLKPGNTVPSGYLAQSQPYAKQSSANRAARQSMPVYLAILEAGAVHFSVIAIFVQR